MNNHPALGKDITDYYERGITEQDRLSQDAMGRLEWLRTREVLGRYLPPPPARVLDVGGGAGTYALPLAREGYSVHLLDPISRHIEQARAASLAQPDHPLADTTVGDARALPYADASADAVLMLGPLYHLTQRSARLEALAEACRVLRPDGMVVAAAISRYASFCDGLAKGFLADDDFRRIVRRDLAEGQHRNPTSRPQWFTTAYFHRPDELPTELADAGLAPVATLAVEGPALVALDLDDWLADPKSTQTLLDLIASVEAVPELIGASPHLLV
ncbi:MAG: class I SAM-dependent methyltransferase, partial [Pseudonocardiaceae bacterium]